MVINVLEYLEISAAFEPEKTVFSDINNTITYASLINKAKTIGTYISIKSGFKTGKPVAVYIDRDIFSLICFMGIVYSGNFYVPIDTNMPKERVDLILDTISPIITIENPTCFLEELKTEPDQELLKIIRENSIDTDPLYALFTSGSTGVPKGVLVSHRSVIDLVEQFCDTFDFDKDTILGNQAPFDFDVSVKDIYINFKVGGTMEILPKNLFMMPVKLVEYINKKKINVLICSVSALRILADFKCFDKIKINPLKYIMFSGEVIQIKTINYWLDNLTGTKFVNLYGPTEITCNCTYFEIKNKFKDDESIPIGKPFKNSRVFLLDENNLKINEPFKTGELCVEGSSLSLGYWNDFQRTSECFVQNLLSPEYSNKIYKTGDLAFYNENHDLVFVSRKDSQIKHMGHRIELGEIENAINSLSFINICCCLHDKTNEKIVVVYEAKFKSKKEIIKELSKKLPKYMWPNVFIHVEKMPLNKNAKIDRTLINDKYQKGVIN